MIKEFILYQRHGKGKWTKVSPSTKKNFSTLGGVKKLIARLRRYEKSHQSNENYRAERSGRKTTILPVAEFKVEAKTYILESTEEVSLD